MLRASIPLLLLPVLLYGCAKPHARLNAPPHQDQAEKPDLQGTFVYMTDNALLESMSVRDYHFLPNRAVLTTLGKQRLYRLAALMEEYGGEVRYQAQISDSGLVADRTDAILDYLDDLGVDTTRHTIARGAPAEQTSKAAEEAIIIKLYEGTYRPQRGSGSSGAGGPGAGRGAGSGGMTSNNPMSGTNQ